MEPTTSILHEEEAVQETLPIAEPPRTDFRIPEENLVALAERIDKLNRRALKLGLPVILFQKTGEDFLVKTRTDEFTGEKVEIRHRLVLVHIEGQAPKIAGWTFAATLQHEEVGNILRVSPAFDQELPLRFRTAERVCEHCGYDRKRKDTYILKSDAGEWKQVGRQCLRDFLGHSDPLAIASYAEALYEAICHFGELEEEGFDGARGEAYYAPQEIVLIARRIIEVEGYRSRAAAMKLAMCEGPEARSTASDVSEYLSDSKSAKLFREKIAKAITEERAPALKEDAEKALDWARNLAGANDFEWNLKVVSSKEKVVGKDFGLLTAVVGCWLRDQERLKLAQLKNAEWADSQFVGVVGKRLVLQATLVSTRQLEGNYGVSTMAIFRILGTANRLKWFASGNILSQMNYELVKHEPTGQMIPQAAGPVWEEGVTYEIKATIKAHSEYKGIKETQITRAAVQSRIAPAPEGGKQ